MEALSKFTKFFSRILLGLGAIGLVVMTIIIGWQVFGRYVLNDSPNWSEQAALVLMIWYVCLAAAAGVYEGFHIRIVALENAVSAKLRFLMITINNIVVGLCGAAMAIWGAQLVSETWSHDVPTLILTRGMVYLVIPIAGALIALFALERLLEHFFKVDHEEEENPQWS